MQLNERKTRGVNRWKLQYLWLGRLLLFPAIKIMDEEENVLLFCTLLVVILFALHRPVFYCLSPLISKGFRSNSKESILHSFCHIETIVKLIFFIFLK